MDDIYKKALSMVCTNKNGKIVNDEFCSYVDKNSCETSYQWPPVDGETYAEFKPDVYGGSCVIASYGVRTMCEDNNLKYNTETGLCNIDEKYCKMKGADWKYNDKIKQNDCIITDGQDIAESIFGTTITRGLKQLFDPAQYEQCNLDETDDGYFCRSRGCAKGDEYDLAGGICHKKCKANYNSNGVTMCFENCPRYGQIQTNNKCVTLPNDNINNTDKPTMQGCNDNILQKFSFNGNDSNIKSLKNTNKCLTIPITKDSPNGNAVSEQILEISDCTDKSNQKFTYELDTNRFVSQLNADLCLDITSKENGALLKLNKCNDTNNQKFNMEQSFNTGLTCTVNTPSRVADCPPGYTNKGAHCEKSSNDGGGRLADCPSGYTNNGATCGRGPDRIKLDSENGRVADCPMGYYNNGTSCVFNLFGRGAGRDDVFYDGWEECAKSDGGGDRNNCEKWGLRVYPKCQYLAKQRGYTNPEKWTNDGCCVCSPETGYRSFSFEDSVKCKDGEFLNKTLGRCYKNCGEGYYNNGTDCFRDASTKGMDSMECKDGEFKSGARCYKNCPLNGSNTGFGTCVLGMGSMTCKDGEFRTDARCYTNPYPKFTSYGEFMNYNRSTYDRGVGEPSVHTRAKKRIVDFSTQDN